MNNFIAKYILIILFVPGSLFSQEIITVGIDNYPPYTIVDGNKFSGIFVDFYKEVFKGLKIDIEIKNISIARTLMLLESGNIETFMGLQKNDEREKFLYYCNPPIIRFFNFAFYFSKKSKVKINTFEDLYKYKIGSVRGVKYFSRFDEDKNLNLEISSSYQKNFEKLFRGRIDVMIISNDMGEYYLNQHDNSNLIQKAKYISQNYNSAYFVISKKSHLMSNVDVFEKNLKRLKDINWFEKNLKKYLK